ncbi:MAG: hypothetical protein BAJALOKI1v1_1220006 [Promethearchaeota archaeon]|nr:MAG: hypothetical protein BAJALOKI1v1_1220006 [Candidatus Lokiarchaeota archaeon]
MIFSYNLSTTLSIMDNKVKEYFNIFTHEVFNMSTPESRTKSKSLSSW